MTSTRTAHNLLKRLKASLSSNLKSKRLQLVSTLFQPSTKGRSVNSGCSSRTCKLRSNLNRVWNSISKLFVTLMRRLNLNIVQVTPLAPPLRRPTCSTRLLRVPPPPSRLQSSSSPLTVRAFYSRFAMCWADLLALCVPISPQTSSSFAPYLMTRVARACAAVCEGKDKLKKL